VVPGNIHTHPGFQNPKFLMEIMNSNWNFQRDGGRGGGGGVLKTKNPSEKGYGYFLEQHNLTKSVRG